MNAIAHPRVDTERARRIWAEYQLQHDLSSQQGRIAAIEPISGQVWIGDSGLDVVHRKEADGVTAPVFLIRIGCDYFVSKGRR